MRNIFKVDISDNRIFGLDILRAAAIFFVVIEHGNLLLPSKLQLNYIHAFDGVSLFFVLSGFLIGGILIKSVVKNGLNLGVVKNFWIRRWFRTLPNYFLILIVLCILHYLSSSDFTLLSVNKYFFFSQNLFTRHPGFFSVAWSLSVEEWFYLILPILLYIFTLIFNKSIRNAILFTCFFVIIEVMLFRYYRYIVNPIGSYDDWDLLFRKQVVTRVDSLMFGVLGAYINYFHHHLWVKYKNQLFVVGIILFLILTELPPTYTHYTDIFASVFSFDFKSLSILLLLPFLSEYKKTNNVFVFKSITLISLISYSIYLLHLSIIGRFLLIESLPWHLISDNIYIISFIKYSIYLILVILSSILLYKYYEVPMTSLRDMKIFNSVKIYRIKKNN